ncbi:hypothetical protein Poly51_33740 [Rubripirellula tenax]|uniref:Uncharacterized protein n=1 Tax=Rubripirellula tenax TaxID=2528015 RepID=A0A5C6F0U5_9BACT|nr:hypothetical protein [Rubripirellula tenax]TWU54655.1 hypothetical protein Poly51_33740 [Rubripirellula tenax]
MKSHHCSTNVRRRRHVATRQGATLIDVAIGSMLLSLLLIPSVRWIGHSESINQRLEDRDAMLFEAESFIEILKVKMSEPSEFASAFDRPIDDLTKVVSPSGKVFLAQYQLEPDKTLPTAKLLSIRVTVWRDANSNARIDATEVSESLQTQMASP